MIILISDFKQTYRDIALHLIQKCLVFYRWRRSFEMGAISGIKSLTLFAAFLLFVESGKVNAYNYRREYRGVLLGGAL